MKASLREVLSFFEKQYTRITNPFTREDELNEKLSYLDYLNSKVYSQLILKFILNFWL